MNKKEWAEIIGLSIAIIFCGYMAFFHFSDKPDESNPQPTKNVKLITFEAEGHQYNVITGDRLNGNIYNYFQGVVHNPDCPCFTKETE